MSSYVLVLASLACSTSPMDRVVDIECRWLEFDVTKHQRLVLDYERRFSSPVDGGKHDDQRPNEVDLFKDIQRYAKPIETYEVVASARPGRETVVRSVARNSDVTFRLEARPYGKNEYFVRVRPDLKRFSGDGTSRKTTDVEFAFQNGEVAEHVLYLGSRVITHEKSGRTRSKTCVAFLVTSAVVRDTPNGSAAKGAK